MAKSAKLIFLLWMLFGVQVSLTSDRMVDAFQALKLTRGGVLLLEKMVDTRKESPMSFIREHFKWGETSRTDTVLTRQYDPKTGFEKRDREVTIYLRPDQSRIDLVLDLAHELVHAVARPGYDPYDPVLTPGKYIWAAIEGQGGEVEAVMTECEIGLELSQSWKVPLQRCRHYLKNNSDAASEKVDRDRVRRDFYRVGKWHPDLSVKLGQEIRLFPFLSADSPQLFSSTGKSPYPVALLSEYEAITEVACNNSRNRIQKIRAVETKLDRTSKSVQKDVEKFLVARCNSDV